MTDPITTPEQMREAAAQVADDLSSKFWSEYKDRLSDHCADPHWQGMSDGAEKVAEAIRAIPVAPQPVAVTVKPLVWHENPDIGEGGYIAKGIFGVMYHAMDDGWSYYRQGLWVDASGLYAAKAAAQADYEARILSAIDATSARDVRAAALREAASVCAEMADQVINAALTGIPEQARLRESMESALTKASHQILALIDKEPQL